LHDVRRLFVDRFVTAGFTLDVAGLAIAVTADDDMPIAADGSARRFVRPDAGEGPAPASRVHARWGDPQVPLDAELVFDSGKGLWRLYRTGAGVALVFTSPALGAAPYQTATFGDDFARGEVTIRKDAFGNRLPIYPLHYPLDEVFMVHLLARGYGVEVHAAGVVLSDDRGWLLVGSSGAGKSTLAKLWLNAPGARLLSDERVILRAEADGVRMYGTPWHGEGQIANPGSARLERVLFLRHGERNELAPVARTAAVARLFVCGFTPFHDAAGLDFSLGLLGRVASGCRCEEFGFVPDPSAVGFLLGS
jgi:hypothetical protein